MASKVKESCQSVFGKDVVDERLVCRPMWWEN